MIETERLTTVREAADTLGVTTGRIRQIAREYKIGRVYGTTRLFDPDDFSRLCQIRREIGRQKKSFNRT